MSDKTALIVPVAGADPVVRPVRRALYPDLDSGMPAHVTLMYPFLPVDEVDERAREALRKLVAPLAPFEVTFRRAVRAEGLLYLAPEPREPFEWLHRNVRAVWPALLPYEGKFGDHYTPHLSVAYGEDGLRDPDGVFGPLEDTLNPLLPVTAHARAVWIAVRRDGHWIHQGSFPMQGDAPVFQQRAVDD